MRKREGGKEGRGVRKKGVLVLEYHEEERGREGGKRGRKKVY